MIGKSPREPRGLKWRSSIWFVTFVVGYGIATDLLVYSVIIPVVPFQLQVLGYNDVSGLTGWLLFAYSAGLVLSTPPIAYLSEKHGSRRWPLLFGLIALMGSCVMFMEAPTYSVMAIARIIQGISSSAVWVVALALLCDTTPTNKIGQQLGLAMSGLTIGLVTAPPIGGALYDHLGFRAPFIFGIACAAFDLAGRLLVIERKDALKWGHDPAYTPTKSSEIPAQAINMGTEPDNKTSAEARTEQLQVVCDASATAQISENLRLSPLQVLRSMSKSSRALAAIACTLIYGLGWSALEPTLPLRLQEVWSLSPGKVGLIFVASAVPTLASSPLAGWYADRHDVEWVTIFCLLASVPWWLLLIVRSHLALFISSLAIASFFLSGVVSPLTAELAVVARTLPGVGYAHVYGAFNLAYGLGSALGPIIAGQMYDHVPRGWLAVCGVISGAVLAAAGIAFCYTGESPILTRITAARMTEKRG